MKLTGRQRAELRWLASQHGLVWGGVYDNGGDYDLREMERAGLIESVAEPHNVGRLTFQGGYRITESGRSALRALSEGEEG